MRILSLVSNPTKCQLWPPSGGPIPILMWALIEFDPRLDPQDYHRGQVIAPVILSQEGLRVVSEPIGQGQTYERLSGPY